MFPTWVNENVKLNTHYLRKTKTEALFRSVQALVKGVHNLITEACNYRTMHLKAIMTFHNVKHGISDRAVGFKCYQR
ncbi:hypothetical protein QV07_10265 [Gallibacterium genomosp. 3]|uniref:Uncharacterized protein n=1 Tax=Gallibacterium genomosp. 3 TaxID=505345 RepID=A0A1A7PP13_9PAST|nr:hypothetical protein QV07_10265 [Gallibacterium genomosp. 3]